MKTNNFFNLEKTIFLLSCFIFLLSAIFGWMKLPYGFNYIDEGYHMAESWRLTVGDHFLDDKTTGALRHFTLINSLIFKIYPNITLLEFRKLQYFLTLLALFLLLFSIAHVEKCIFLLPLVLSIFAFTGLDPIGMISNLSYHTYPHLFMTLAVASIIFGLNSRKHLPRITFFTMSGCCMWFTSLSVLHMGLVILTPILLYFLLKKTSSKGYRLSRQDVIFTLFPFTSAWILFMIVYNKPYITNIVESARQILATPLHSSDSLLGINWELIKHMAIIALFLTSVALVKKLKFVFYLLSGSILSIGMYTIIDTSLFGWITRYYNGLFGIPMWFAALIITLLAIYWASVLMRILTKQPFTQNATLQVILLTPGTLMAIASSIFSGLGVLTTLHASILLIAGLSFFFIGESTEKQIRNTLLLIFILAPFYLTTAWFDWNFTYFDVVPAGADATIESGFGKGIKTNQAYKDLYSWIEKQSSENTNESDYIISYVLSPMVHMITKRKPALDDTFISFGELSFEDADRYVEMMIEKGRLPKMAFMFEYFPALKPISLKKPRYAWMGRQFTFPSNDPISRYIFHHMELIDTFQLHPGILVRCYRAIPDVKPK